MDGGTPITDPDPWWITGFVDGEGCFSISLVRNSSLRFGFQVFVEFVVTQSEKSRHVLEDIMAYFGCGRLYVNNRSDDHNERLYRYCVRSREDLRSIIVPFFQEHPLRTAKAQDFQLFAQVVEMMNRGEHLQSEGFNEIKLLAAQTNRRKSRL